MSLSRAVIAGVVVAIIMVAAGAGLLLLTGEEGPETDLRALVEDLELQALDPEGEAASELVALGEALFFDKELSGNRDIACATCHHPVAASGDDLSLSIGTGGAGLATDRRLGADRGLIPRNAPEVFNRGASEWHTMFWDNRVTGTPETGFATPAGDDLPEGLDSVLAAQAMFPVTSPDEMRGAFDDIATDGQLNELARLEENPDIWEALMRRLLAIDGYVGMFAAAYPGVPVDDLGFQHAANAIGAYEAEAFAFAATPWDAYLAGDDAALGSEAEAGALLFFGEAGCARCHSGALFTDQVPRNIGPPQVGPGKGIESPDDFGRARETASFDDLYAFRTPPLRNVELTGPWFHDGAYTTLEGAIRHHLDPVTALVTYDPAQLRADVRTAFPASSDRNRNAVASLDPLLGAPRELSDQQIALLEAFLRSLTDPAARDLTHLTPASVPSGLPVDR